MRFAGNAIWFVFGAFTALLWLIGAALFALSIVGLPLARAALEMARMSAFPFGKDVAHVHELDGKGITPVAGTIGLLVNILWLVTFGLALCACYLVLGVIYCLAIVGIPQGIQCFKLAGISLWPVGWCVVSTELATVAHQQAAVERFARYRARKRETPGGTQAQITEPRSQVPLNNDCAP